MKNKILNEMGAISKQVVVGTAIGVATLAVGIGLMNNFSSSGSQDGRAAIEKGYSYTPAAAPSGASAEEILMARNSAQGGSGVVSPIIGGQDIYSGRNPGAGETGSMGSQAGMGQTDGLGEDASVKDYSDGYGSGEIEGMGTSKTMAAEIALEEAAKAQAQRDAKIAKGAALGEEARATLTKSSLGGSGSSFGGSSSGSGASYNFGANTGAGSNTDTSKIKLDTKGSLSNINLQANAGKIDSMNSKNREAEGARGRSATGQNYEALGDLGRASKYSKSGKSAVGSNAALGAADASAAFDGSQGSEGIDVGEGDVHGVANALDNMGGMDNTDLRQGLDTIQYTIDAYNNYADHARKRFIAMLVTAAIAFVAALAAVMTLGKFYGLGYAIAGSICLTHAAIIAGIMWGGQNSYANCINNMIELSNNNSGIGLPGQGELLKPWALYGLLNGLMACSFLGALGTTALGTTMAVTLSTGAFGFLMDLIKGKAPKKVNNPKK